jgi:hypothetical protein
MERRRNKAIRCVNRQFTIGKSYSVKGLKNESIGTRGQKSYFQKKMKQERSM